MNGPPTINHHAMIDTLREKTKDFKQPIILHDFFDEHFLNEFDIKKAIETAIRCKAKDNFRVWMNREEVSASSEIIIKNAVQHDESIKQWADKIFKDKKLCILFSQAQQFNDDLAVKIGKFLSPLFEKAGMTLGGSSLTIFIGNYGYTPVGVHIDEGVRHVFHFHLGPGLKQLLLWDPLEFEQYTGSKESYFEPEKILPYAKVFELRKHDCFCLPTQYYHIGNTMEFSIDIAVVVSDATNIKLTQDIFNNITAEAVARSKKHYQLDQVPIDIHSNQIANDLLPKVCLNEKYRHETLENVIKFQLEDLYLTMTSNLGWNMPPILDSEHETNSLHIQVQITHPYKIYYRKISDNKIALFLRGRELIANNYLFVNKLIDQLNLGAVYTLNDLIHEFASEDFERDTIQSFIHLAIEYKAIKIVKSTVAIDHKI